MKKSNFPVLTLLTKMLILNAFYFTGRRTKWKSNFIMNYPKKRFEIRHKVFVEEQGFQNEFDETDKFSKHLVLYDAEIPIATCRFFPSSYRKYIIGRIAVIKQYRGQNIGSRLLTLAENEIKKVGGTQIYLHAQDRARKFYEKKGYSCCGKIDLDEKLSAYMDA